VRSARGAARVNADASQPLGADGAATTVVVEVLEVVVVVLVELEDVVVANVCGAESPLQATSANARSSATRLNA
jgi:hypothetical protein